jgi:16S rRNA (adenine1518-N6/adenine1519-N6)-dimethyltransferase
LLKQYDFHPSKRLGQNFLLNETALQKVAAAANLTREDVVLEIGPGLGSLTRHLAGQVHAVTAVELDERLLPVLYFVLTGYTNVRVIHGDILKLNPSSLVEQADYLVVANIPYNITSAVIRHLLESTPPPRRIVLTIQKEVAERICARPGDMSLLALSVQIFGKPSIKANLPAQDFLPKPEVDSAIIAIETASTPVIPLEMVDNFFRLARAGFSQKRKTLRNSLSAGLHIEHSRVECLLTSVGIDPRTRAETLTIEDWARLCRVIFPPDRSSPDPSS